MRDFQIRFIAFSILAFGHTSFAANAATTAASATVVCQNCHSDFAALRPENHTPIEDNEASCMTCHHRDIPGTGKTNPFLTRIHLAHQPPQSDGDCLTCHSWSIGKSFGLIGALDSWGAPNQEDMTVIKEIFASWSTSGHLDNLHAKASISCSNCHGKKLPNLDATVDNQRCLECHGPMEQLAKTTEPADFKDRNPHHSHLGEIDCTVCHTAHGESKVYCLGCHQNFAMTIPGAAQPKP